MKLSRTRRHWEKFARTDPMWAVLTVPEKAGNRWKPEEFFANGREVVDAEIAGVRARYPALGNGRALDFGCGVGRLTQALTRHFSHVTGVDISANMLALARQHNQHGARVDYVHNTQPDLSCFPANTFDFVYSIITLQHMEPRYARLYIKEFVRVLAPGGAALFQLPASGKPRSPRRFSLWPATLAKRFWRLVRRLISGKPVMEMHTIPREEVLSVLQAAGAEVLNVYRYDAAGATFESYGYLIRKP